CAAAFASCGWRPTPTGHALLRCVPAGAWPPARETHWRCLVSVLPALLIEHGRPCSTGLRYGFCELWLASHTYRTCATALRPCRSMAAGAGDTLEMSGECPASAVDRTRAPLQHRSALRLLRAVVGVPHLPDMRYCAAS